MTAKKKTPPAKKKRGQPTRYTTRCNERAYRLCKEKGFTNANLAVAFKVTKTTIQNWVREHPLFAAAVQDGKDDYDTREIEQVLLKRARGYRYDEKHVDVNANLTKTITKEVAPDTTAIIFWLKNRGAKRWSDKQEVDHQFNLADFFKAAALEVDA